MRKDTYRIHVSELRPGMTVTGMGLAAERITIRNGFSGPLAYIVEWAGGGSVAYSPHAHLTVDNAPALPTGYVHTGFEAGML